MFMQVKQIDIRSSRFSLGTIGSHPASKLSCSYDYGYSEIPKVLASQNLGTNSSRFINIKYQKLKILSKNVCFDLVLSF